MLSIAHDVNGGIYGRSVALKERIEMPKYLKTFEVAELLRTPVETVRYWRHVGKGPKSFKAGRAVLYDVDDVEAFIAQAKANSAA